MRRLRPITRTLTLVALAAAVGCAHSDRAGHEATESSHAEHEEPDEHDEHDEPDEHDEHEEGIVELSPEAAKHAAIRVAIVEETHVPFVLRTTARVDYDERRLAHVSPRIPGRVATVRADLGDDVVADDQLATLDSIGLGEAKADYLGARAEASLADKTLERAQRLFKDKITSEQAVIEARAAHEKALAHLRSGEEKLRLLGLSKSEIRGVHYGDPKAPLFPLRAPIDGRIVEKHLVVGEIVRPEDKVFTIADLSQVWIWIDIYERDVARVHKNDTVVIATQAHPDRTFEGHVAYIRDRVDPVTRAARARIDILNPDRALKPGMFAQVTLTDPHCADPRCVDQHAADQHTSDRHTADRHTAISGGRRALAVPPSAVQRDGDVDVAFVMEGERRYARRVVRVGARTEKLVEIVSGLASGERVAVEGAFLLKSEAAKEEMGGGHSH